MERKLRITVDGRKYDVTVEDLSDVSSLPYSQPGMVYMPPAAPAAFAPPATASAPAPAPKPAGPAAAGDVVCTLGGVVESILVTLGQQVNAGDRVADHRGDENEDTDGGANLRQGRSHPCQGWRRRRNGPGSA